MAKRQESPEKLRGGWLFKEEPDHYSYDDLERDQTTLWDGVENNLARKNLRKVQPGDRVLYYHTGKVRAIVGEMTVLEGPMADPKSADPKAVVVKVKAARRWAQPLTLQTIKEDKLLKSWDLVRVGRLSVVPVSQEQWRRVMELAGFG
ncbi:MAG: EVE domain-containing protein [Gemmataceae bacterium]|nr:EVE domain-containing protein [Gemmataceae bacterium]MCI0737423.1 EVE domain-containing protein [Gemmataceae bacterium]